MKISILINNIEPDLDALKAVPRETLADLEGRMVGTDFYYYYKLNKSGDHRPDDATGNDRGWWVKKNDRGNRLTDLVDDGYDFGTNSAVDLSDTDSHALDVFLLLGGLFVGTAYGFMDWLSNRDQIKLHCEAISGTDYSTWESLSESEKKGVLPFVATKLIDRRGFDFYVTECIASGLDSDIILSEYLNVSMAVRQIRYNELMKYIYHMLGKRDGLAVEDQIRNGINLGKKYIDRGVLRISIDGVDGITDFIQATDSFSTLGLFKQLANLVYTIDETGTTDEEFCDNCEAIITDGKY